MRRTECARNVFRSVLVRQTFRTGCVLSVIVSACLLGQASLLRAEEPAAEKPRAAAAKPAKRYVIIHADDAGMSHSVNQGTIEAMKKGIVSSASIMVPCPWFIEFAEFSRDNPELDYGIHLTLNSEWHHYRWGPVAGKERVPSLVDPDGYMWDNVQQVAQHATPRDVETELRAQIERAKKFGVPLSHLDTHMGTLLSRPEFLEIYVNLGLEYDLPVLYTNTVGSDVITRLYPALKENGVRLMHALDARQMPLLSQIHQFYEGTDHRARKKRYLDALKGLKPSPAVTEIIIHCGIDNEELKGITSSHFIRDSDRRIFTDPEVIAAVKEMNIEVITWKQFREMANKSPPRRSDGK